MSGKWVLIALLTFVAMFGLGGLTKHKWKTRLALLGMVMGLMPPHQDLVNAVVTPVVFGVIFLLVGAVIDLIVGKFFFKKKKTEIAEEPKTQAIDQSEVDAISGFDLERVKKIARAKNTKTAE
jgi:hypothetical protein